MGTTDLIIIITPPIPPVSNPYLNLTTSLNIQPPYLYILPRETRHARPFTTLLPAPSPTPLSSRDGGSREARKGRKRTWGCFIS